MDDFIELLKFQGYMSPVLVETCSTLLRTILGDSEISMKVRDEIPDELSFSYRGSLSKKSTEQIGDISKLPAFESVLRFVMILQARKI